MTVSLAVVCEAPADLATASGLFDRVLCEAAYWIADGGVEHFRQYRGLEPHEGHLLWREVRRHADERRIRPLGHFGGQPGATYAHNARRALLLLQSSALPPDGIMLVIDDDGDRDRRVGLHQARQNVPTRAPVVIGVAHSRRECWVLAGFVSSDDQERGLLDQLRQELSFDPCTQAERLNDRHPHELRSAKRVLGLLVRGDSDREARCWQDASLATLEARGQDTGLAEFLQELRKYLLPLFLPASDGH